jgi:hypothetical protein
MQRSRQFLDQQILSNMKQYAQIQKLQLAGFRRGAASDGSAISVSDSGDNDP